VPDWPTVPLFVFLTVVAFARGGTTYALGRGGRGLSDRRARLDERPSVQRAEELVGRYGAPAVTLSFLTVGVQTAVNLAAGTLRMPLPRYLPALLAGALIWATIYLTLGLAVLGALVGGRSELLLLAAVAVVVLVVTVTVVARRRR
jgi:membrane protein DedA with SNARE-associated domain